MGFFNKQKKPDCFLEARQDIEKFINFYNVKKSHSALSYLSPMEFC
ncbi:IS3 family transposase [Bacillus cereus]